MASSTGAISRSGCISISVCRQSDAECDSSRELDVIRLAMRCRSSRSRSPVASLHTCGMHSSAAESSGPSSPPSLTCTIGVRSGRSVSRSSATAAGTTTARLLSTRSSSARWPRESVVDDGLRPSTMSPST